MLALLGLLGSSVLLWLQPKRASSALDGGHVLLRSAWLMCTGLNKLTRNLSVILEESRLNRLSAKRYSVLLHSRLTFTPLTFLHTAPGVEIRGYWRHTSSGCLYPR